MVNSNSGNKSFKSKGFSNQDKELLENLDNDLNPNNYLVSENCLLIEESHREIDNKDLLFEEYLQKQGEKSMKDDENERSSSKSIKKWSQKERKSSNNYEPERRSYLKEPSESKNSFSVSDNSSSFDDNVDEDVGLQYLNFPNNQIQKGLSKNQFDEFICNNEIVKSKNDFSHQSNDPEDKTSSIENKLDLLAKQQIINNYIGSNRILQSMINFSKEEILNKKAKEIISYKNIGWKERIKRLNCSHQIFDNLKFFYSFSQRIQHISELIVTSKIFEMINLFIIIVNSIFIFISDPSDNKSINSITDDYFLYYYTLEFFLKVFAFGLVMHHDSYLRNVGNIVELTIILLGWIYIILESN